MELQPGGDVSRFGITTRSATDINSAGSIAMNIAAPIIGAGTSTLRAVTAGRINTATNEYRVLGFLLGTAAMRIGILREISEAYQGRSRRDGNKDQCRCNAEFGLTGHNKL